MLLLLDTSAAILVRDGHEPILNRLEAVPLTPLISILTRVELEGGVHRHPDLAAILRPRLDLFLTQVTQLPFEDQQAEMYGRIVAAIGFSRARIIDRMIAAQALVAGATVATLNPRDFSDVLGLNVEDWSD